MSVDKYSMDEILLNCLSLIVRRQKEHGDAYGLVGAAVVAPNYPIVYDTSVRTLSGKWRHAERSAIDKFKMKFGELPNDVTIVTTLSLCFRDMDDRFGESCSDFLESCGIKKVYVGIEDFTHLEVDPDHYDNLSFEQEVTQNDDLKEMCLQLLKKIEKVQDIDD